MAAAEFVSRLEALGFSSAERPALRASDIEWLFLPSHPCSALLRAVSERLPQCAFVSTAQQDAFRSLVADGKATAVAGPTAGDHDRSMDETHARASSEVDSRTLLRLRCVGPTN